MPVRGTRRGGPAMLMAKAVDLIAGGAASGRGEVQHRRGAGLGRRRRRHRRFRGCQQADDEALAVEPRRQAHLPVRREAQVDIVPSQGGIAARGRGRARDDARMRMALDDPAARLERGVVERVGELAEPAADRRHHAALLQHAAGDVAARGDRGAEMTPDAEHRPRGNDQTVEGAAGDAQILDLAELEAALGQGFIGPEGGAGFGQQMREAGCLGLGQKRRAGDEVSSAPFGAEEDGLGAEDQLGIPGRARHGRRAGAQQGQCRHR